MAWKSIHCFACDIGIALNTSEQNLAHTWIMEVMRFEFRSLIFQEKNIRSVWQTWLASKSYPCHTRISRLAEYIYKSSSCQRILKVLGCLGYCTSISKGCDLKGNIWSAKIYCITWLTISYIECWKIFTWCSKRAESLQDEQTLWT